VAQQPPYLYLIGSHHVDACFGRERKGRIEAKGQTGRLPYCIFEIGLDTVESGYCRLNYIHMSLLGNVEYGKWGCNSIREVHHLCGIDDKFTKRSHSFQPTYKIVPMFTMNKISIGSTKETQRGKLTVDSFCLSIGTKSI
jgi:hypothetical protein